MGALAQRFMQFAGDYGAYFNVARRNVSDKARCYLAGLLMKSPRKNMERMEEYVGEFDYQSQQQFISDSPWDPRPVMARVAKDVGAILGGPDSALLIDESGFSKKGVKSAGVARQWNGRLGKLDNCQVGVFAALSDETGCALVDARLYLPQAWCLDPERCKEAKIPESSRVYRSKPELALEMIGRAASSGLAFGWVGFDSLYGSATWLLREVEDMGLQFAADVRGNQSVYAVDPKPRLPRRRGPRGPRPSNLRSTASPQEICEFFGDVPNSEWREVEVRKSTKGRVRLHACARRVWLWDGKEVSTRCWWALATMDADTGEVKYSLANAPEDTSLEHLVRRSARRYWIERGFQDAKTSLGMADYQARGWPAWHHHMAMVTLAMLFMLKERRVHMISVELLSCQDLVDLLNIFLPRRDRTLDAVLDNIARRHRKRRQAIISSEAKSKRSPT